MQMEIDGLNETLNAIIDENGTMGGRVKMVDNASIAAAVDAAAVDVVYDVGVGEENDSAD